MSETYDFSSPGGVSLATLLDAKLHDFVANMHTCMPGEVIDYNADDNTATIQPHQMRQFIGADEPIALPLMNKVPINFYRTANAWVRLPVAKGDKVLLVFSERSLDPWLTGDGSTAYHDDVRRFDLSDAIALPGIYPFAKAIKAHGKPSSVELANGSSFVEIEASGAIRGETGGAAFEVTPGGKVSIGTEANEVIAILSKFVDTLINAKTQTALGLQSFFVDTLQGLNALKEQIEALKK